MKTQKVLVPTWVGCHDAPNFHNGDTVRPQLIKVFLTFTARLVCLANRVTTCRGLGPIGESNSICYRAESREIFARFHIQADYLRILWRAMTPQCGCRCQKKVHRPIQGYLISTTVCVEYISNRQILELASRLLSLESLALLPEQGSTLDEPGQVVCPWPGQVTFLLRYCWFYNMIA